MTYVVLARKWRPRRFDDVVGQEHITRTLSNALTQNRVAHGYLFCGPRGVGKTTTARILAKALNCEKGPTAEPCNECPVCRDVDQGRSLDIIEVDGASTRGIDDVRELRESVRYAPTGGRTKVYIIDEVHMLTREAFNALLKTLEEPPPHVVFVMATTEPFKVPATILSRCQRFDFARIHPKAVIDRLAHIVGSEGFKVQADALAVLARRSQGGLRDALSTLDQVLTSADEEVTAEMVNRVLGIQSADFYFRLTDALIEGDPQTALALLDDVYHAGADLGEIAEELARHLRNVMLLSVGPDMEKAMEELGPAEIARVREQAAKVPQATAARLLDVALRATGAIRRSEHLRLHLEMTLVELASVVRAVPMGEVLRRIEDMERRLGGGGSGGGGGDAGPEPRGPARPAASGTQGTTKAPESAPTRTPDGGADREARSEAPAPPESTRSRKTEAPTAAGVDTEPAPGAEGSAAPAASALPEDADPAALWDDTVASIKKKRMSIGAFLIGSRADGLDGEGRLRVIVDAEHSFFKSNLEDADNRRFIEGVMREVFGRPLKYDIVVGGAAGEEPPQPKPKARSAFEIAETDPGVRRVLELFDGEIAP